MSSPGKRPSATQRLRPSLLDRLIDDRPDTNVEGPMGEAQLIRELRQSVRRDLEQLLNTRVRANLWPEHLTELRTSLVNYGIPDFTASGVNAAQNPDVVLDAVAQAIRTFEPRLKEVRVSRVSGFQATDRTLKFRIDAVLQIDPLSDPVRFESTLEPNTGAIAVKGGGG
jgi:type VI secretion system protein ImpF